MMMAAASQGRIEGPPPGYPVMPATMGRMHQGGMSQQEYMQHMHQYAMSI